MIDRTACRNALFLMCSSGQLRVFNRTQLRHKVDLVERDLARDRVLDVLHYAIRERTTLDRQLAKLSLEDL